MKVASCNDNDVKFGKCCKKLTHKKVKAKIKIPKTRDPVNFQIPKVAHNEHLGNIL